MNPRIEYYTNGNKKCEYYFNDLNQLHNKLGPAVIEYYENGNKNYEEYYINNKGHNIKGPAYIKYDKNGEILLKHYWFNNKRIDINSDEEFQKYIKRLSIM